MGYGQLYAMFNVINPKLRMNIAYSDTAQIMWEDMKKRYAMANTPKIHQLKANIANCKQGDLDVGDFYSKLMHLWNELSNLVKFPYVLVVDASVEWQAN